MEFEIGKRVRLVNADYLTRNELEFGVTGVIKSIGGHPFYKKPHATVELENGRMFVVFEDTIEYITEGAASKATTVNPKDLVGNTKVSLSKVPVIAVAHCAMAMMDGAEKYGPFNWRDKEVVAHIYIDAAKRHLDCWFEGQEVASDSKVHHLGHAMACCAILLDAQSKNKLVDDRPKDTADLDFLERQLAALSEVIKRKKAEKAAA